MNNKGALMNQEEFEKKLLEGLKDFRKCNFKRMEIIEKDLSGCNFEQASFEFCSSHTKFP